MASARKYDEEALLPENNNKTTHSTPAKFWLGAEFAKNFVKTLTSTAISNATLITYLADLPNWKFGVGLIAAEISCPLALLFALAEAYAHYQQSSSFVAEEDDTSSVDELDTSLADIPLTKKQIAAAIFHYCSDVLEDATAPLVLTQLLASEASLPMLKETLSSSFVKKGLAIGAILFSALGNVREVKNTVTASRKINRDEMQKQFEMRPM